jgi:hypothetical protein
VLGALVQVGDRAGTARQLLRHPGHLSPRPRTGSLLMTTNDRTDVLQFCDAPPMPP